MPRVNCIQAARSPASAAGANPRGPVREDSVARDLEQPGAQFGLLGRLLLPGIEQSAAEQDPGLDPVIAGHAFAEQLLQHVEADLHAGGVLDQRLLPDRAPVDALARCRVGAHDVARTRQQRILYLGADRGVAARGGAGVTLGEVDVALLGVLLAPGEKLGARGELLVVEGEEAQRPARRRAHREVVDLEVLGDDLAEVEALQIGEAAEHGEAKRGVAVEQQRAGTLLELAARQPLQRDDGGAAQLRAGLAATARQPPAGEYFEVESADLHAELERSTAEAGGLDAEQVPAERAQHAEAQPFGVVDTPEHAREFGVRDDMRHHEQPLDRRLARLPAIGAGLGEQRAEPRDLDRRGVLRAVRLASGGLALPVVLLGGTKRHRQGREQRGRQGGPRQEPHQHVVHRDRRSAVPRCCLLVSGCRRIAPTPGRHPSARPGGDIGFRCIRP